MYLSHWSMWCTRPEASGRILPRISSAIPGVTAFSNRPHLPPVTLLPVLGRRRSPGDNGHSQPPTLCIAHPRRVAVSHPMAVTPSEWRFALAFRLISAVAPQCPVSLKLGMLPPATPETDCPSRPAARSVLVRSTRRSTHCPAPAGLAVSVPHETELAADKVSFLWRLGTALTTCRL
jgi:hypothetical protein